jgi:WD40 repeat protein
MKRITRYLPLFLSGLSLLSFFALNLASQQELPRIDEHTEINYPLLVQGNSFLSLGLLVAAVLLFGLWILQLKNRWVKVLLSVVSLLAGCSVCFLSWVSSPSLQEIQSLQIQDHIYHLVRKDEVDFDLGRITFIIFKCDQSGVQCQAEYVSDERTFMESEEAHLGFDSALNQLYLERSGRIIYVAYQLTSNTPAPIRIDNLPVITVQNAHNLAQIARLRSGPIRKAVWISNGEVLAVGRQPWRYDDPPGIWFYDARALEQSPELWMPEGLTDSKLFAFSSDSRSVATVRREQIVVWALQSRTSNVVWEVTGGRAVTSIAFHPNNTMIAYGTLTYISDDVNVGVDLLNLATSSKRQLYERPEKGYGRVNDLAFSPDGQFLAVAGSKLSLWSLETGIERVLQDFHSRADGTPYYSAQVSAVAFSPTGAQLASANDDGTVSLWNITATEQPSQLIVKKDVWPRVYSVAFSPDGKMLAGKADNGSIFIWDTDTANLLLSQPRCTQDLGQEVLDWVGSVVFNPTGTVLTDIGPEGVICLWGLSPQTNHSFVTDSWRPFCR